MLSLLVVLAGFALLSAVSAARLERSWIAPSTVWPIAWGLYAVARFPTWLICRTVPGFADPLNCAVFLMGPCCRWDSSFSGSAGPASRTTGSHTFSPSFPSWRWRGSHPFAIAVRSLGFSVWTCCRSKGWPRWRRCRVPCSTSVTCSRLVWLGCWSFGVYRASVRRAVLRGREAPDAAGNRTRAAICDHAGRHCVRIADGCPLRRFFLGGGVHGRPVAGDSRPSGGPDSAVLPGGRSVVCPPSRSVHRHPVYPVLLGKSEDSRIDPGGPVRLLGRLGDVVPRVRVVRRVGLAAGFYSFERIGRMLGFDRPAFPAIDVGFTTSNVYTVFRTLIQDYGTFGSLIVVLAAGFVGSRAYRAVIAGRPAWLATLTLVYAFMFAGMAVSVFSYTVRSVGAAFFIAYIVVVGRPRCVAHRTLSVLRPIAGGTRG